MELKKYWEILWRRKWIFLQAVGVIVLVTIICVISMKPIYKATTQVKIDIQDISVQFVSPESAGLGNIKAWLPPNLGKTTFTNSDNVIGTFQTMIENKGYVSNVIKDLDLKHTDDLISIRDRRDEFIEVKDFIDPNIIEIITQRKGVDISQISDSDVFEINGYSVSSGEAVNIANKVASSFLNLLKDINRQKITQVYELMEKEVLRIQKELAIAEKAVEDYRKGKHVISLDDQKRSMIDQKSKLEDDLYDAQRSYREKKSDLQSVKEALSKQPEFQKTMTNIEDNPLLLSYKNTLLSLEVSLAKALAELTPQHPTVKEIQNQIEQTKRSIEKEVEKAFASHLTTHFFDSLIERYSDTDIKMVSLKAREQVLSEQIKDITKDLNEIPSKELELYRLSRKVDALNASYIILLGQLEMAKIARDMEVVNATIISPAVIPSTDPSNYIYFPKKAMMTVLSLFLGVSFGLFLVFFLEYLDDSIRSPKDVMDVLDYPVLGVIPMVPKGVLGLDMKGEKVSSLLMDRFLDLRSSIKLITSGERPKVISVMSAEKDEGKTTISTYFTYVCSQQSGERVLLIDSNFRGHNVTASLNLSGAAGLSNFLEGQAGLDEIIQTRMEGFDLISSGPLPSNPLRLLESVTMRNLIESLRERYDLIIVDTPAVDVGNDAISISRYCDKVLFVIASGESSVQKIKRIMESFKTFMIPVLGIILNKAETGKVVKLL
jgi:succinoglycan biosynthesis transport protein ExoP